jgi:hypothetical protein
MNVLWKDYIDECTVSLWKDYIDDSLTYRGKLYTLMKIKMTDA